MPDGKTIHATVAVPNFKLFEGDVYYAEVPGYDGQYGVLPGHELNISLTRRGGLCTLYLDEAHTQKQEILLYDGVAEVVQDRLIVLARLGKIVERIHGDEMEERTRAQQQVVDDLKEKAQSDDDPQFRAQLEEETYRLNWYQTQVDWAKKNNK